MEENARRSGVGMILGKFLPPHAGHQYLIEFGRQFVERLYVLVCSLPSEPIDGVLRHAWVRELFPTAQVIHVDELLPQEPAEHPDFWSIWRDVVQRYVGEPIDFVFASEPYGERLATELGATFVPVDLSRSLVPVSGTAVRADPLGYWDYLPECVRAYFVKRVCLFGPESTGKSTLARDLAQHYRTLHVPEFAREWLNPRQGVCAPEDIPIIARGQIAAEEALARRANRLLFCDTDPLLTQIWSEVLFGACPEWIRREAAQRRYDLYLLLDVDVPWVDDSQRYLPQQRQAFFDRCRTILDEQSRPFVVLSGAFPQRFTQVCRVVDQLSVRAAESHEAPEISPAGP